LHQIQYPNSDALAITICIGPLLNNNQINAKEEPINKQVFKIPYEDSFIELPLCGNARITELIPPYIEPLRYQQIIHSLQNPIGKVPLSEIAKGKNNVLIILENATRPLDTCFIALLIHY
jgi:hypothetical protein